MTFWILLADSICFLPKHMSICPMMYQCKYGCCGAKFFRARRNAWWSSSFCLAEIRKNLGCLFSEWRLC